jgi:hypothetical protein
MLFGDSHKNYTIAIKLLMKGKTVNIIPVNIGQILPLSRKCATPVCMGNFYFTCMNLLFEQYFKYLC